MQTNTVLHMLMALCALNEGEAKVGEVDDIAELVENLRQMAPGRSAPLFHLPHILEVAADVIEEQDAHVKRLVSLVDDMAKVLGAITEAYETDAIHKLLYRVSLTR